MPIYMKYDGVTGNVTESSHTGWIELSSFSWGLGRAIHTAVGSSDDREASAPSVSEVVVTKDCDVASTNLLQEALSGFGKTVQIDFARTAKGQLDVYLTLTLTNTMVSGHSHSSNGADGRPQETLSLNFSKFEYKFTQMDTDASPGTSATAGYDLSTAKTV
jgi:type VI secretion system secreted protein Hcp